MRVRELIDQLRKLPQDAEVRIEDEMNGNWITDIIRVYGMERYDDPYKVAIQISSPNISLRRKRVLETYD